MTSEKKIKQVEEIKQLAEKYPVIGIVDLFKMPSKQLQAIKKELRGKAIVKMYKKRLIEKAFQNVNKKDIKKLLELNAKEPCLIFSEENPFRLYKFLEKNKSPTYAKEGDIAQHDIIIPEGPTTLMAGPAIGELQRLKIPAMVQDGKIYVRKDTVIVKKDEVINDQVANVLKKLDIQPVEIGINLLGVWEQNTIFTKDILHIDEQEFMNKLITASSSALNLSVSISYPNKDSITFLLQKAFRNAKTVGLEAKILDKGIIEDLISKANAQACLLKSKIKEV